MGTTNYNLASRKDPSYCVCTESPLSQGYLPLSPPHMAASKGRMWQESIHLAEFVSILRDPGRG